LIEASCHVLIRRDERFAKTAVGWLLRELAPHDGEVMARVLEAGLPHFSREALNNALKPLPPDQQQHYRQAFRQVR
jgi:3-methyladenine DNA glycosylase AlkD